MPKINMKSIKTIIRLPMLTHWRSVNTSSCLHSYRETAKARAENPSPLLQLRQKTGLAYQLCREALDKYDNDVTKAENWLRSQALNFKPKVIGRSAREGIVGIAIQKDKRRATVLELNCETDFVVKNQVFKDFALTLTEKITSMSENCLENRLGSDKSILELRPPIDSLDSLINPLVTRLGENIKVNRASHYQSIDENVFIFAQIHAQAGHKVDPKIDIMTGRFGAIVALKRKNNMSVGLVEEQDKMIGLGNRLCRHIIGYNPTYIELPDSLRKELEEAERQAISNKTHSEEAGVDVNDEDSDTEENIVQNSRDDWPSLMDQQLILSDNQSVRDYCHKHDISIAYFERFECGERT